MARTKACSPPDCSDFWVDVMVDDKNLFPRLVSDLLGEGRDVRFRAPGRSMYPAIREGETITVCPVAPSAIKKGEIILYRWQEGIIAHRVAAIVKGEGEDGWLIARGDASGAPAERVRLDQVLGRVIAVNRNGRRTDLCGLRARVRRILYTAASRFKRWALPLAGLSSAEKEASKSPRK